jgi:hypothetical protein
LLDRFSGALLKYRDISQQRNHAEDDHDNPRDLLGAPVERQQVDQIQNQNDDQKRDQYAYKHPEIPLKRRTAAVPN